jgi:uncharacterized protein YoxC
MLIRRSVNVDKTVKNVHKTLRNVDKTLRNVDKTLRNVLKTFTTHSENIDQVFSVTAFIRTWKDGRDTGFALVYMRLERFIKV